MESTNNNSNQMFLSEFKELRKELSSVKKRIVQLEESHEKQQKRIDILESENYTLKTELNNLNDSKAVESILKRKRTEKEEETESKSTSVSSGKKKTKTNNNDDDEDEAVVISQYDNGDSFDCLSDDLLHKVVEFDGNCYSKFGSINKRCRNIYDVKEYKLKKQTCVYGYGTVDMMLQHYLKGREVSLVRIGRAVMSYNRLDAIEWTIQLEDIELLKWVCSYAAYYGKTNILINVFVKANLTILSELLQYSFLSYEAASNGKLEILKWLRNHGCLWNADTFHAARENGDDEMIQYLRTEGCPETFDEDDEDGDY